MIELFGTLPFWCARRQPGYRTPRGLFIRPPVSHHQAIPLTPFVRRIKGLAKEVTDSVGVDEGPVNVRVCEGEADASAAVDASFRSLVSSLVCVVQVSGVGTQVSER